MINKQISKPMGNMSYCRFENTSIDLDDCIEAIENGNINELSVYEIRGILNLRDQAKYIVELWSDIEEGVKQSKRYNLE
tara:strand:- start:3383 stop:3619 length:237 start_codon:yes stop_codon:yes gene_type:complete